MTSEEIEAMMAEAKRMGAVNAATVVDTAEHAALNEALTELASVLYAHRITAGQEIADAYRRYHAADDALHALLESRYPDGCEADDALSHLHGGMASYSATHDELEAWRVLLEGPKP